MIGSTNSNPSNSNENGGLSGAAIGGIVGGLVGLFILIGVIVSYVLSKRAEKNSGVDCDTVGLIEENKTSAHIARMATPSPVLGESGMGEKSIPKNDNVNAGVRIYWNKYM